MHSELVHGTAIAVGGHALLIRGPSGSGKSDLALRCLVHPVSPLVPEPALLVADDQVLVERRGATLVGRAPDPIRGKLEVRGLGIIDVANVAPDGVPIILLVELVPLEQIDRLPDMSLVTPVAGVQLPLLRVTAAEASAPTKVMLALGRYTLSRPGR